MIEVKQHIEIHVADGCNLHCESCTHFSSHNLADMISPDEADRQMSLWSSRIKPSLVVLLGGEPTINPKLTSILLVARKHWPTSPIQLATNGFFLDRHPELDGVLKKLDIHLRISRHNENPEYTAKWAKIKAKLVNLRRQKVDVYIAPTNKSWTRRYHGSGSNILPFHDHDQRTSWQNCTSRKCTQLRDDCLWKCPFLAYLRTQKKRWPEISAEWDLGLAYQPLRPAATDDEIQAWFATEDEIQCSLCPAHPESFKRLDVKT